MPTYSKYELKPKKDENGKTLKPESRWMVKGYLGENPKTGLPKYTTMRGYKTSRAAKDAFNDAVYEFTHAKIQPRERMRLNDLYPQWLESYRHTVSAATVFQRESSYRLHIKPALGDYYIDMITRLDVQKWMNKFCRDHLEYAPVLSELSLMMDFAIENDLLDSNPCTHITRPRDGKADGHHLANNHYSLAETRELIVRLGVLAAYSDTWSGYRAVLLLILATGCRVGEIQALKWKDIDFDRAVLNVRRSVKYTTDGLAVGSTKTASGTRTLSLPESALKLLASWCERQCINGQMPDSEQWVFTGKTALGTISKSTARSSLCELSRLTGMRRVTPHGLRHTKATLLAQNGVDVTTIAGILGHKNVQTTISTYIHPSFDKYNNTEKDFEKLLKL
jgi:integrase